METFINRGAAIRNDAKRLVLDYMADTPACRPDGEGARQAVIFRECGLDWGEAEKATSSNQQYWLVALLRALQAEGRIEQVERSGPWRLTATS